MILPAGREAEYQFASRNGLRDLAVQADTRRLITARLNKPHTFGDMASIQSELSPLVLTLVPRCLNTQKESIPYMALGDDNDWTQIEYNFSPVSGDYFIEERECGNDDEEGAPAGSLMRRLLFVQNQNFVQTECRLLQPTGTASVLSKGQKKRLKKKTKANTTGTSTEHKVETSVNTIVQATTSDKLVVKFIFDHTYLDSHHSAALTALSLVPNLLTTPSSASPSTISGGGDGRRGLLVGLGGGSMAMSLQKHLSDVSLVICELDGRMVDVATEFFGFVRSHHTSIVVGDGMQYINECAEKELCRQIKHLHINTTTATSTTSTDIVDDVQANSFTYIFIDVDGKDTTLGLTAPPETFISQQSLQSMYDALAPDGVLILNVVARGGQEPIDALVARLKSVFVKHNNQESGAFMIKPSETTVNIIIAAVKCGVVSINKDGEEKPLKTSATSKKKTSKKRVDGDSSNRLQSIRIWLDSVHGSTKTDPLNLTDLVTKLVPL